MAAEHRVGSPGRALATHRVSTSSSQVLAKLASEPRRSKDLRGYGGFLPRPSKSQHPATIGLKIVRNWSAGPHSLLHSHGEGARLGRTADASFFHASLPSGDWRLKRSPPQPPPAMSGHMRANQARARESGRRSWRVHSSAVRLAAPTECMQDSRAL